MPFSKARPQQTTATRTLGYGIYVVGNQLPDWLHTEVFLTQEAAEAAIAILQNKYPEANNRLIVPLTISVPA